MTIDELNNALADMREKMMAKGYPNPGATVYINSGQSEDVDISIFQRENGSSHHIRSVSGHKCPHEAVTRAHEIIDDLPKFDRTETIKLDLADAIDRARAAGVDVSAVIGGK